MHERLTTFVRDTLGCQCPAEAFSQIVVRLVAADDASPVKLTIEVGGRLLVHVVEGGEAVEEPDLIQRVVEEGVRARDARGFNRFRLVIATPGGSGETLQGRFDVASARDDRTHIHILPAASIPW